MASEMVMAFGDHGLELTALEDTVEIPFFPLGPGNRPIPASLRFLQQSHGGGVPTRLLSVRRAKDGSGAAYVEFECTPTLRYETDAGPVYGHRSACWILSTADSTDALFDSLCERERARIVRTFSQAARRQDEGPPAA